MREGCSASLLAAGIDGHGILPLAREYVRVAHRAFRAGLQTSTGGNLSIRLPIKGLYLVKASGGSLADTRVEHLLVVDEAGTVVWGTGKPTKEVQFHLGIYRVRPDVGGVCHYHATYATGFACAGRALPLVTVHSRRILRDVPLIPPVPDGSPELAQLVTSAFADCERCTVLLQDHGFITVGPTLIRAHLLAELVEETARIAAVSQLLALSR